MNNSNKYFWAGLGSFSIPLFIISVLTSNVSIFWKQSLVNLLIAIFTISVALFIAITTFQSESKRINKQKQNRFKRFFVALLGETSENLAVLEQLKEKTTTDYIMNNKLSTSLIEALILNPYTYKFTGKQFFYALRVAKKNIESLNSLHDYLFSKVAQNITLTENHLKQLNILIDSCEHKIRILQNQNQYFIITTNRAHLV